MLPLKMRKNMGAEENLAKLGHTLPVAAAPAANYVPFVRAGNVLFIAGQLPLRDGKQIFPGRVGVNVSPEDAKLAAEQSALNILAQIKAAVGSLDKVVQIVRLGAFISCTDDFTAQPEIANGASDLMVAVFGDRGKHARTAVGTNVLPRGASVEIDAIIEVQA
jgi:enamine deaminase RidA (YjgF/YER057c/UK114 family)